MNADEIKLIKRERAEINPELLQKFDCDTAESVNAFHRTFPEYTETPLVSLADFAAENGVSSVYIKDESFRFGLNAFKVLGSSYAVGRLLAEKLNIPADELSFARLTSPEIREKLKNVTFISATDGNHGRGLAWTAARLGAKSVILMPKGSARERLENIRALGAEAYITDLNYDDTVRLAAKKADENGWIFVQDTAWDGYEEIPLRIMQGYITMGSELKNQLPEKPTHIFLQAGVGAMAGAMAGFFTNLYTEDKPKVIIVEPHNAACIYKTAEANDGKIHKVDGALETIMAGLSCGEPCSIGYKLICSCADYYISMPDEVAMLGMRLLAKPCNGDKTVVSGESGAAGFGMLAELLLNPEFTDVKDMLGIDENSIILCISTEGDTDKENYRRIVG